jgi:large subunit ribosomal protein L9
MEVLLKKNVDNLGDKDEIVSVKNGFGRNFLIPQKMAVIVTDSVRKMHAETMRQRSHKLAKLKEEAQLVATKLAETTFKVGAKVGENGKIFGSVTNVQVADAITKGGFDVERRKIKLLGTAIKSAGTYEAEVKLHKEITVKVSFEVVGE